MGRTRRKKKVTQRPKPEDGGGEGKKVPKAFVIERGKVGHVLNQLVLDLRQIMEPNTASRLKVYHKNVLKDFVTVAGPLGVTHLVLVSRTTEFVNLKICVLPRGPTVTFHVKTFSLTKEVLASLKTPANNPTQFLTPPMLALNNFSTENKASHLLSTVLQNMFPSISVHSVNLANIKRCVLFNFDPDSKLLELRHYATRVVPRGTSRGVKKLSRTHLPDLGKLSDISEYLLGGYASESDGEELGGEGQVTLPQDLPGKANLKSEQSTVRLSELGPRLTLQLIKIESGLCGGEVLHHEYVHKSRKETRALHRAKEGERHLKQKRKREQEANVARKEREKEDHKARCLAGMIPAGEEEEEEEEGSKGDSEDDDREWFRKEVGEEPDPDMFGTTKSGGKAKVRGHKRHLGGAVPEAKRRKQTNTGRAGGKKGEQSRGGKASAAAISPGGTRGKKPRNMVSSSRKFEGKKRKQTLKQFKNRRTATHT